MVTVTSYRFGAAWDGRKLWITRRGPPTAGSSMRTIESAVTPFDKNASTDALVVPGAAPRGETSQLVVEALEVTRNTSPSPTPANPPSPRTPSVTTPFPIIALSG